MQNTALGTHETLEVHELMNFKNTCCTIWFHVRSSSV